MAEAIRRRRLHEVSARLAREPELDWARLAAELGYADQAHLVRDFSEIVAVPPARYLSSNAPEAPVE